MPPSPQFCVLLPAAGSASRFGGGDKLLTPLGRADSSISPPSVLQRSVALFASRSDIASIVIITNPDRFDLYRAHLLQDPALAPHATLLSFVAGGRERWESVLFGLRHLARNLPQLPSPFVAIHDAARPLCPASVIDAAFRATSDSTAALPCIAEPATLKRRASDGSVSETVSRTGLFQAQTPQCFPLEKLLRAYEQLSAAGQLHDVTDDAQIFERVHWPVQITPGSSLNLKITTPEDVALANALLAAEKAP